LRGLDAIRQEVTDDRAEILCIAVEPYAAKLGR
jgi:hypothetical protein